MDTIGDFITIIRNASTAFKPSCKAQWSKIREAIAKILLNEGYIAGYKVLEKENGLKDIQIHLKYVDKQPAIVGIERHSKPGRRLYYQYSEIPKVLRGLGINILTTSKGLLTGVQARQQKVGGELLCNVW